MIWYGNRAIQPAHQRRHHRQGTFKFTRDNPVANTVRQVEPGSIRVGEQLIMENLVLTPDEVLLGLPLHDFDRLSTEDLEPVLDAETDMLILGAGWRSRLPPRELVFAMARRGIAVEIMDTPAACRTFNILIGEGRRPIAILNIREE